MIILVKQGGNIMKVSRMIKELQKYNPDAEVKLHHKEGHNALFVVQYVNNEDTVIIEDKSDNDLSSELDARFQYAVENDIDELDFFMDLIETGITLDDIKENLPEKYEYSKLFLEEHGLI